ncbi:hypothetical protein RJT34_20341 [Clitoria ternatea]|uniref:Uncharacterized protein n=1 Tax=Clitoria ternatea TaxID=43366 RepID=A0AAN9IT16_CLITE
MGGTSITNIDDWLLGPNKCIDAWLLGLKERCDDRLPLMRVRLPISPLTDLSDCEAFNAPPVKAVASRGSLTCRFMVASEIPLLSFTMYSFSSNHSQEQDSSCEVISNPSISWPPGVPRQGPRLTQTDIHSRLAQPSDGVELEIEYHWCAKKYANSFTLFAPTLTEQIYHIPKDHFLYFHDYTISKVGVWFPLNKFEMGVLRFLDIAPNQLHPNGWALILSLEVLGKHLGFTPTVVIFFQYARVMRRSGTGMGFINLWCQSDIVNFEAFAESCKIVEGSFKKSYQKLFVKGTGQPFWKDEDGRFKIHTGWTHKHFLLESSAYATDQSSFSESAKVVVDVLHKISRGAPIKFHSLLGTSTRQDDYLAHLGNMSATSLENLCKLMEGSVADITAENNVTLKMQKASGLPISGGVIGLEDAAGKRKDKGQATSASKKQKSNPAPCATDKGKGVATETPVENEFPPPSSFRYGSSGGAAYKDPSPKLRLRAPLPSQAGAFQRSEENWKKKKDRLLGKVAELEGQVIDLRKKNKELSMSVTNEQDKYKEDMLQFAHAAMDSFSHAIRQVIHRNRDTPLSLNGISFFNQFRNGELVTEMGGQSFSPSDEPFKLRPLAVGEDDSLGDSNTDDAGAGSEGEEEGPTNP